MQFNLVISKFLTNKIRGLVMAAKNIFSVFGFLLITAFFNSSIYAESRIQGDAPLYKIFQLNLKTFPESISPTVPNLYSLNIKPNLNAKYLPPQFINHKSTIKKFKHYTILGNEIATLVNEEKSPGEYEVEFVGSELSSGVYIYKLTAGSFSSAKKLVIIK